MCVLQVPALRERPDDIPALARHLLKTPELGARELSPGAIGVLRAQAWPGNVRELRNVVVQAALRAGGRVQAEHVIDAIAERAPAKRRLEPSDALRIFTETGNNQSAAARRAGVARSTMRDLLRAARRRRRRSRSLVLFADPGAPPALSSSPYFRTAPPPPWRHTQLDENHRRLRGWCRSTPAT